MASVTLMISRSSCRSGHVVIEEQKKLRYAICLVLGACCQLWADVRVDYSIDGTSFTDISAGNVTGLDVSISNAPGGVYRVYATPVTESVGDITIESMGPSEALDIIVAGPPAPGIDSDVQLPPGCTDLGSISASTGIVRVQISVLGDITGNIGEPPVFGSSDLALVRCDAPLGSIYGSVFHTSTSEDIVVITCDSLLGGIESTQRRIESVICTSDMSGSLTSRGEGTGADGSIGTVTVAGVLSGDVIFQSTVDTIVAASFASAASVRREGPGELNSHGVGRITATSGDLEGDYVFPRLRSASEVPGGNIIRSEGSMRTLMRLNNGIDGDGLIQVGDSLSVLGAFLNSIELGDHSPGRLMLGGQIVVNANNSGGTWNDFIRVLSDGVPSLYNLFDSGDGVYPVASASLGGGSVGLVPYSLNRKDTSPPGDGAHTPLDEAPTATSPIQFWHYGPVGMEQGVGPPLTILRVSQEDSSSVFEVSDCFSYEPGSDPRTILASPTNGMANGFEYFFFNAPGVLKCSIDGLLGPDVSAYPTYSICVGNTCAWDIDSDGTATFTDLNILLDKWGLSCQAGDIDNNGTVDFGDLNTLLEYWGMQCPGGQAAAGAGSSAMTAASFGGSQGFTCSAVTDMGFSCHDHFRATFEALTPGEQDSLIAALKAVVEIRVGQ